jgi:hypothetical protein
MPLANSHGVEYNINLRLRQFFKDLRAFRSVQGSCNALIIDSYVPDYFDFFRRWDYLVNAPELHCETKLAAPLAEYIESEGYVEYNPWPYSPFVPDMHMAFRRMDSNDESRTIHIELNEESALYHLLEYVSDTKTLHIISWNNAYSVFPYETSVSQKCHILSEDAGALHWYLGQMQRSRRAGEYGSSYWPPIAEEGPDTILRRTGDKYKWIPNLDIEDVTAPTIPDAILESNVFEVRRLEEPRVTPDGPETCLNYRLGYGSLRHPVLKYQYLLPPLDRYPNDKYLKLRRKVSALMWKVDYWTVDELRKVREAERSLIYREFRDKEAAGTYLRDIFPLPADWKFDDDEVLEEVMDIWEK